MSVSEMTISAVKNISPDDMVSRGVIERANDGKTIVCPQCGNGTHKRGSKGIEPSYYQEHWSYHCFSCDAKFDNIALLGLYYSLDHKNDKEFIQILKQACEDFDIPFDGDDPYRNFERVDNPFKAGNASTSTATSAKNPDPAEIERAEKNEAKKLELIRRDISEAQEHLNDLPVDARRGLSVQTLRHFGCGFLERWTSPTRIIEGQKLYYSRRLIIPTSTHHYLASAVDRNPDYPKSWKLHEGSKEIFNSAALTAEGVVIITEGEIDAMSIWEATNGAVPVIAIGGAAGKEWIDSLPEKTQFLIMFDNDDTGKRDSKNLREELIRRGYPAASAFLSSGETKLDANDILRTDGADVLADKVKGILDVAKIELEKAAAEIAARKALKIKIDEWTADNGEIDSAVMTRLKSDVDYLQSLTTDKITAAVAAETKTLRAVANCRYYVYRDIAESFMARVDEVRAEAQAKVKKSSAENPVDSAVRELAAIPARNKLEDSIAKFTTEINKAHRQYQKKLAAQRENEKAKARRAEKQKALNQAAIRLEELKAMEPSPDRDSEIRAIIIGMCDWKEDSRGNKIAVRSTAANYKLIFQNDPVVDGLFGFDEFQQSDVFLKKAPWKKKFELHEPWQDSDDSALRVYLRETYTELANDKLCADYLSVYSRQRSFHVIKDWLESLPEWDGVERAETVFIDYLRVDDTAYSRAVTMNWLTGALARVFRAGCEYQTAVVLNGSQGIGKSALAKMLGGKWYVALKDSVEDSHAVDVLQTGWIVEIEEFWAGSKAEVSALKAFISASADDRRAAYARRAQKSLRHCAFLVTCNDEQFLKDVTGNRRFLILRCNADKLDNSAIRTLTPEIIEQIWAEALYKFRLKFPTDEDITADKLELPQEFRVQAENIAQDYMYDDGLAAEIGSFLNRKIPHANIWEKLTKEQRRRFIVDNYIELDNTETEEILKDQPHVIEEEILKTATPLTFTTAEGKTFTRAYRFRGVRYRYETCAAEIFNECFGNDNRKKIRRINEILPTLECWQLLTKPDGRGTQRKDFADCYGNQKRIYSRVDEPVEDDSASEDTGDDYQDPGLPF